MERAVRMQANIYLNPPSIIEQIGRPIGRVEEITDWPRLFANPVPGEAIFCLCIAATGWYEFCTYVPDGDRLKDLKNAGHELQKFFRADKEVANRYADIPIE